MTLKYIDDYADELRKSDPTFDQDLAQARMNLRIALAVKELRKEMGLSQRDFAKLVGKSSSTIARIESGEVKASSQTLTAIAVKTHKQLEVQFV